MSILQIWNFTLKRTSFVTGDYLIIIYDVWNIKDFDIPNMTFNFGDVVVYH